MDATRLQRFKEAQENSSAGFDAALSELRSGAKRGHWIWYVFPQLAGLGSSSMSRTYGLAGIDEAEAYLHDDLLRARLLAAGCALAEQIGRGVTLERVMGSSIDVLKLVSSLTLFGTIARRLAANDDRPDYMELANVADDVLMAASAEGYPPCAFTLEQLGHV